MQGSRRIEAAQPAQFIITLCIPLILHGIGPPPWCFIFSHLVWVWRNRTAWWHRRVTAGAGRLSEIERLYASSNGGGDADGTEDSDCDDGSDYHHRGDGSVDTRGSEMELINGGAKSGGGGAKKSSFRNDHRGSGGGASVTFSEGGGGFGGGGRHGGGGGGYAGERKSDSVREKRNRQAE